MLEVGRLVVKTAGRDAGEFGVVIEVLDDNYVMLDGNVRRKKVNRSHVEPLGQVFDVKKGAKTEEVRAVLDDAGIELKVKGEAREAKPQTKKADKKADSKKKETKKKSAKKSK